MTETIGADLYNTGDRRYYVNYDEKTKVVRIIDAKHPEMLKVKNFDEDIPDTSPAVTIIPELMLDALLVETAKLGLNPRMSVIEDISKDAKLLDEYEAKMKALTAENVALKTENSKKEKEYSLSEGGRLKKDIVDKLFKLAVAEDLKNEA